MVRPSLGSVSLNKQGKQGWFWFWFLSQTPGGELQAQVRRVGPAVSDPGHTEPRHLPPSGGAHWERHLQQQGPPSPPVIRHPRSSLARLFQAGARKLHPSRTLCSAWAPTGRPFGPQGADPPPPYPTPCWPPGPAPPGSPSTRSEPATPPTMCRGRKGSRGVKGPLFQSHPPQGPASGPETMAPDPQDVAPRGTPSGTSRETSSSLTFSRDCPRSGASGSAQRPSEHFPSEVPMSLRGRAGAHRAPCCRTSLPEPASSRWSTDASSR